jgi:hypothetical protein
MATWIAHLRLAENLLERIPDLDEAQFATGNIAPDSGIPDENWEKFNPPPQVTHFKITDSVHKDIADLNFYRQYLANINPQDTQRFSFRLGYFFHLITDNLWSIKIGIPTTQRYAKEFSENPKFIWTVKEDWYGLDFIHVRDYPDSLFWRVFLQAQPLNFDLDFLPLAALEQQLQYIKNFYQRTDEEIQARYTRDYSYLSQAEMDQFIAETTDTLEQVYLALWQKKTNPNSHVSALQLLETLP